MKKNFLKILVLLAVGAIAFLFNRFGLLQKTLDWIHGFGVLGPCVFILVFAMACVFFVPSIIFTFSGGALFGMGIGVPASLAGITLGSTCAFLIGRYLVRGLVEKFFMENKEFQRLSRALQKKGWKIIILARFSPVFPFWLGNYAFGATRIDAWHYALATAIGSLPSTLLFTYLGFLMHDLSSFQASGRARTPQEWALLGFGLLATVFLAWYLRRVAESGEGND